VGICEINFLKRKEELYMIESKIKVPFSVDFKYINDNVINVKESS
jgi:hypothetical protein